MSRYTYDPISVQSFRCCQLAACRQRSPDIWLILSCTRVQPACCPARGCLNMLLCLHLLQITGQTGLAACSHMMAVQQVCLQVCFGVACQGREDQDPFSQLDTLSPNGSAGWAAAWISEPRPSTQALSPRSRVSVSGLLDPIRWRACQPAASPSRAEKRPRLLRS